ncbi:MAG: multifunctional oxoglutarate decarboxylase/oxoglutarate dehydrogenase thiamine pyrophosphate-binding subunit/dihydrolipoyllysine-residue succinyltransferase subunit [Candidatus Dormibacteria bacterium]
MSDAESVAIVLPAMGESVTEGTVARWLKAVGDPVTEGETVVEVTTDKVDVEVPAPANGTLAAIAADEGVTVPVGGTLGAVAAGAGAVVSGGEPSGPATKQPAPASHAKTPQLPQLERTDVHVSPLARRRAAVLGVDVSTLVGTGPNGSIRKDDVHSGNGHDTGFQLPVVGTQQVLKGAEKVLVGHMERSRSIPTATSFRTLAVDMLEERRKVINHLLVERGISVKLSFTHIIAFAIAKAASRMPHMASYFTDTPEGASRVFGGVHLGLAVDFTKPDGSRMLLVPVIRNADTLSFHAFVDEYERLVHAARTSTLSPDDMQGGTLTLTNPGGLGTVASVPRLMAGQGTIVAVGSIAYPAEWTAVPQEVVHQLGISKVMTMTSTYDHRIIQGAESGAFLRDIEGMLQGEDEFYEKLAQDFGVQLPPYVRSYVNNIPTLPDKEGAHQQGEQVSGLEIQRALGIHRLLVAYREVGHLKATLDPLHLRPVKRISPLDPGTYHLQRGEGIPSAIRESLPVGAKALHTVGDLVDWLESTYCQTIGFEYMHCDDPVLRAWIMERVESHTERTIPSLNRERVFEELSRAYTLEEYLRKTFLGEKVFSLEGIEVLVPALQLVLDRLIAAGTAHCVLGMAHRGRQAVISRVVTQSYDQVLRAYEYGTFEQPADTAGSMGDVKYHLSGSGTYTSDEGKAIAVHLLPNPSHLEAVDAVVEGWTRALQVQTGTAEQWDVGRACPILIHGDAAFIAQGGVTETLNLAGLAGYTTGGTLHIIANNQLGFTTNPDEGRSTAYATDVAKGFGIPVIHVNADDVESVLWSMLLAYDIREQFHRDVVIDIIGYRRYGHNETDEPSYTQPVMYDIIKAHTPVHQLYGEKLTVAGMLSEQDRKTRLAAIQSEIKSHHQMVKSDGNHDIFVTGAVPDLEHTPAVASLAEKDLRKSLENITTFPERFTLNPKLVKQMERRAESLDANEVDFGTAEALAFASLLHEGVPIRLSGQDTLRGTFSHRHAGVLNSQGEVWIPLQHLPGVATPFTIVNSPLSELACIGFEYGYAAAYEKALVLWEAQFGDFINNAQMIVDQFIASGRIKWGQHARLVLLLPHGYEGMGPEHSSCRIERFLQLGVDSNLRVVNCSTAAQYFHLLRDQAHQPIPLPLVVATPKSLLRNKAAAAGLQDLITGHFQRVIDDPDAIEPNRIRRVLFCSGHVYYDLIAADHRSPDTAIVRLEQLYPFPAQECVQILERYAKAKEVIWVQEEPENMGAWWYLTQQAVVRDGSWHCISRPPRASAAEGSEGIYHAEQHLVIEQALRKTGGKA